MRRIGLAVWVTLLVAGSFLPARTKSAIGTTRRRHFVDLIPYPPLSRIFGDLVVIDPHRIVHYFAFGITAFLLIVWLKSTWARIATSVAVFVMAVSIEAGEHFVFHNPFEWLDVRDDSAGIVMALAIVQIVRTLRKPQAVAGGSANPEASGK